MQPSPDADTGLDRSLLHAHEAGDRAFRRQTRDLRDLHAPAGGLRAAAGARLAEGDRRRRATPASTIDLRYARANGSAPASRSCIITGSFLHLVDLETIFLQKLGPACVAAFNAFTMCADLPKVAFLAMDARHCAGLEMAEMMAYAASVGSARAKRKVGAMGFVGNATEATAHYFGRDAGAAAPCRMP